MAETTCTCSSSTSSGSRTVDTMFSANACAPRRASSVCFCLALSTNVIAAPSMTFARVRSVAAITTSRRFPLGCERMVLPSFRSPFCHESAQLESERHEHLGRHLNADHDGTSAPIMTPHVEPVQNRAWTQVPLGPEQSTKPAGPQAGSPGEPHRFWWGFRECPRDLECTPCRHPCRARAWWRQLHHDG